MPRFVLAFAIACLGLVSQVQAAFQAAQVANEYPTILVHGFTGWGRKELLGFKYWGGNNNDYQERLLDPSYNHKNIMTAEIGPFSSNWDRACELYAQIKGGRVDYGPNHSNKHGHARYGRTFPGLFPQWGTVVNGKLQKVHLMGHSMGGQTIRLLTQLLNKGTAGAPIAEDPASHPLFAGGKDWVHSVTTVSASNQGTTVADAMGSLIDKVEKAAIAWFGAGIGGIYDAKLDHFNMAPRGGGESVASYVHRIFTSSFFSGTATDNARTDMTTAGAKLMNNWVRTLPNVYYYSISSQSTFSLFGKETPNPVTTILPLLPIASHVAGKATTDAGFPKSWQANDGQVNVPSQLSDGTGKIVPFEKTSTRGVWNQYPTHKNTDHFAITGNSLFFDTLDIFDAHLWVLASLPPHEQLKRRLTEGEHDVHEHSEEMVKYVADSHRRVQEQAELGAIRMCQENKGLTREQSAGCGRFLEAVAPGTEMAPLRMLRGNF